MRGILLAATAALLAGLALSGCVSTVASVVTAPVRIASKGFDMATTSQSESDQKRGREIRKREERYGKLDRAYRKHTGDCERGSEEACSQARNDYEEMQDLRAGIPVER